MTNLTFYFCGKIAHATAKHSIMLAELRRPAASTNFVSLVWFIEPSPEPVCTQLAPWCNMIVDQDEPGRDRGWQFGKVFHSEPPYLSLNGR
jgi:hypothetical protein